MPKLRIFAARTGTNAPTIRYYESIGLLPSAALATGGQRTYGEADLKRLLFIRRCREFGLPIEQVLTLVCPCSTALSGSARHCSEASRRRAVEAEGTA